MTTTETMGTTGLDETLQEFDRRLPEAEEAQQRAAETLAAVRDIARRIAAHRRAGAEGGLDLLQFRRFALLHGEPRETDVYQRGDGRAVRRRHLFATPSIERFQFKQLVDVPERVVDGVRRRLERELKRKFSGRAPAVGEPELRIAVERACLEAVVEGELETAGDE